MKIQILRIAIPAEIQAGGGDAGKDHSEGEEIPRPRDIMSHYEKLGVYYALRRIQFKKEGFWRHSDGAICG